MADFNTTTFRKLLAECGNIRIPEIQRDYAQGRTNGVATEVREGFLSALLPVLQGNEQGVSLDFIYGYTRDGAFEPLDGQQRLTTLFILHWMFGPADNCELRTGTMPTEVCSRFRYATRISSGAFCDALVGQSARSLIDLWRRLNENKAEKGLYMAFSAFIRGLCWFEWAWRYDPTVSAMLTMMDSVIDILERYGVDIHAVRYESLDHVYFHRLDLDGATVDKLKLPDGFRLGEELYVKMNARGKELSEFDKLKSTLEEEIQYQKLPEERFVDDAVESKWRSRMDGIWADYFWQTKDAAKDEIPSKQVVETVEVHFLRFLTRIIALDLLEKIKEPDSCANEMLVYRKRMEEICTSLDDEKIRRVLDEYVIAIRYARQKKLKFPRIGFKKILDLLDVLVVKDGESKSVSDVTQIACPGFKWLPLDCGNRSLLREFINHGLSHDRRIELFGIVAFVRSMELESGAVWDQRLCENFRDWIRFVRNCSLLQNQQAVRIDGFPEEWRACEFLSRWARRFADMRKNAPLNSDFTFRDFLSDIPDDLSRVGFDPACVREEEVKARLCSDENWKIAISRAEDNQYLWGQLRALLNWCEQGNVYDFATFKRYADKLCALFPVTTWELRDKVWKALLCLYDYRFSVANKQTLITFNDHRDVSWKRYMRDGDEQGVNAPGLKELLTLWMSQKYDACDVEIFLDLVIADYGVNVQDWRKYVIFGGKLSLECCPAMGLLVNDNRSGISGHKWFVPKQRIGASYRSFEVFTCYLYYSQRGEGVQEPQYYDSLEPDVRNKNSVVFTTQKLCVRVQAIDQGKYVYDDNCGAREELPADEIINRLKNNGVLR